MNRYKYEVKVGGYKLGKILAGISPDDQPRVVKRFMREPVLVWDDISEYAAESLNEYFGQRGVPVLDLRITKL